MSVTRRVDHSLSEWGTPGVGASRGQFGGKGSRHSLRLTFVGPGLGLRGTLVSSTPVEATLTPMTRVSK